VAIVWWRIEFLLAGIFVVLTLVTAVWPMWIESLLGVTPDGGNGAGERWVALVFGVCALAAAVVAHHGRRSARAGGLPEPS
jgi:hypothetical protein